MSQSSSVCSIVVKYWRHDFEPLNKRSTPKAPPSLSRRLHPSEALILALLVLTPRINCLSTVNSRVSANCGGSNLNARVKNPYEEFSDQPRFWAEEFRGGVVIGSISDRSRCHRNGCAGKDHDWLTLLRAELNRAIISKCRRSGKL